MHNVFFFFGFGAPFLAWVNASSLYSNFRLLRKTIIKDSELSIKEFSIKYIPMLSKSKNQNFLLRQVVFSPR